MVSGDKWCTKPSGVFPRRVDVRQASGRKNNDEKHVLPTPLSVGKGRKKKWCTKPKN
jgi:hypothetical protein